MTDDKIHGIRAIDPSEVRRYLKQMNDTNNVAKMPEQDAAVTQKEVQDAMRGIKIAEQMLDSLLMEDQVEQISPAQLSQAMYILGFTVLASSTEEWVFQHQQYSFHMAIKIAQKARGLKALGNFFKDIVKGFGKDKGGN